MESRLFRRDGYRILVRDYHSSNLLPRVIWDEHIDMDHSPAKQSPKASHQENVEQAFEEDTARAMQLSLQQSNHVYDDPDATQTDFPKEAFQEKPVLADPDATQTDHPEQAAQQTPMLTEEGMKAAVHALLDKINLIDPNAEPKPCLLIGVTQKYDNNRVASLLTSSVYTLDKEHSEYERSFKFDFNYITKETLTAVTFKLHPRFREIVFDRSTFKFVKLETREPMITFLAKLLYPEGRLYIPDPQKSVGGFRVAGDTDQSNIDTIVNACRFRQGIAKRPKINCLFKTYDIVRSAQETNSDIVKQLYDEKFKLGIKQIFIAVCYKFPDRTEGGKPVFLPDIVAWTRTITTSPAFLIIGDTPGDDGRYAPELLLLNKHVYTWDKAKCDAEAPFLDANDRFFQFDFNNWPYYRLRESVITNLIQQYGSPKFDEIGFDWSVIKFATKHTFPPLIILLHILLKPGGKLLVPYSAEFLFMGSFDAKLPAVSLAQHEENKKQLILETKELIRAAIREAGFTTIDLVHTIDYNQSDVFNMLKSKNEEFMEEFLFVAIK